MPLIPIWAKPTAILGLKLQIAELMEQGADVQEFLTELKRIEDMK
jgi:hypothetical protein